MRERVTFWNSLLFNQGRRESSKISILAARAPAGTGWQPDLKDWWKNGKLIPKNSFEFNFRVENLSESATQKRMQENHNCLWWDLKIKEKLWSTACFLRQANYGIRGGMKYQYPLNICSSWKSKHLSDGSQNIWSDASYLGIESQKQNMKLHIPRCYPSEVTQTGTKSNIKELSTKYYLQYHLASRSN